MERWLKCITKVLQISKATLLDNSNPKRLLIA